MLIPLHFRRLLRQPLLPIQTIPKALPPFPTLPPIPPRLYIIPALLSKPYVPIIPRIPQSFNLAIRLKNPRSVFYL